MKRSAISILVLLSIWWLLSVLIGKPFLPPPQKVFLEFLVQFGKGELAVNLGISLFRILSAQALAFFPAAVLAIFSGVNENVDKTITPAVYLLFPIPKVALLPVILLFLGLGNFSKIFLVALVLFFQFYLNIRDEVINLDRRYFDSINSLGGTFKDSLIHLIIPATLPRIFSTLRLTLGTSLAVLFLAETFATRRGIGYFIMDSWGVLDYNRMYAGIVGISLMGFFLFIVADWGEKRFCRWKK